MKKKLIISFLISCLIGAGIFFVLTNVSIWAYLISIIVFGLFGILIAWARGYY